MTASLPKDSKVYRFKVHLRHSNPQIWRRIEVPASYSFFDLHVAIDDAFERRGDEWHAFQMGKNNSPTEDLIGRSDASGLVKVMERETTLSSKFSPVHKNAVYTRFNGLLCYVFYNLNLEQILTAAPNVKYPRCTGGERINTIAAETPGLAEKPESAAKVFSMEQITFRDPKTISDSDYDDSDDDS